MLSITPKQCRRLTFSIAVCASSAAYGLDPVQSASNAAVAVVGNDVVRQKLVSNIWVDTDIREVVQDVATQTDVVILCDQSVQGTVSMSVRDMSLPDCLERVCATGGYSFTKVKDYYVIGRAEPGSPMFDRLAQPKRLKLTYIDPDQARSMLHPSMLPYVTFDKPSGAVVITAPEPMRQRIVDAIAQFDQPNGQVAIEAVVFELTEDGSKQLALDWQFQTPWYSGGSQNLTQTFSYGPGTDLATHVDTTLRAIVEASKGQVLANPRVMVMNNTESEIFVGQEKYFTLLSGQSSNPYYTLQSIKAGVSMKVLPSIGKDGTVLLTLEPEVSDVQADNTTVASPGAGTPTSFPVVTRRHEKTTVSLHDGETVVIGGLLLDQHRSIIDKVPLAGDIPGIGAAFRTVNDTKDRQEVVILVTVHLVDGHRPLADRLASRLGQRYVTPLDAIGIPYQRKKQ